MTESARIRVDGREMPGEALSHLAMVNYGHFTAMQVRGGRVRGLSLHLDRLRSAHAELYGTVPDLGIIRERIRQAAAGAADAYLRVTLFESEPGRVRVMTVLRAPVAPSAVPLGLLPVVYQRPLAHIKHVGSFGQIYYGRLAEAEGFDDALLTTDRGEVSETTMANIAFIDRDGRLVWPSAPSLHGITRQILDAALANAGIRARSRAVTLKDLAGFAGAVVTNSVGVVGVRRIGDLKFIDDGAFRAFSDVYASSPWDVI